MYRHTLLRVWCTLIAFNVFTPPSVLQLEIKSWLVTGDSLSMELLKTEKGNTTMSLSRLRELQNTSASPHRTVRPPHFKELSVQCFRLITSLVLAVYTGLKWNLKLEVTLCKYYYFFQCYLVIVHCVYFV